MKLKKWLIISYLIVMITPLILGYSLYMWIKSYDSKREFDDYLSVNNKISQYDSILSNHMLYEKSLKKINIVKSEDKNNVDIILYNKYRMVVYSSQEMEYYNILESESMLYSNLYKLEKGYRAYSFKKPVFYKNELIGFYKIIIARNDMIENVNKRSLIIIVLFIFIVLTIFILVIMLLNKRLNHPLELLINEMRSFGKGNHPKSIKHNVNDEIGQLIDNFEKMSCEIEKAREEVNRQQKEKEYMAAAISHDLKTPLTSIRAYTEALCSYEELNYNERKEYLSIILNKCDYMHQMLQDLSVYTILSDENKLNFVEVDGEEFFEMLVSDYEQLCIKKNIRLLTECSVDGIYMVDVKNMIRVVDNLMSNAIRHTPYGKRIYIGAFSKDKKLPSWITKEFCCELEKWRKGGAILLVRNEGTSIKNKDIENIFKPLYQVDESRNKSKNGSVGLGLSICKKIIENHNGKIKGFSNEKAGTIIACWIKEIK
ncbi:sensor histidine kinase [Haloimpatiens sp. FM7330]|uniref:sensor histidine kinase n=1 Tax=Haloimpatiens sp. FM7330 TaxID=3298610 RepID=UPI00362B2BC7